jgi:hypothetical protein
MRRTRSDLCHCCEPPIPAAPTAITNRPGLTAIAYRIGTFATFRSAMLHALRDELGLSDLTTRASDDYSITLLELWAAVADVLTFYQERIANEAFLRTALHRDSVLRLARLLDYRLRPGLAAETRLAFTIDPNQLPAKGNSVPIPVGVKVMSIPGPGEQPQFFETIEEILGDARINALSALPVPALINPFAQGTTTATVLERPESLAVGDRLLFFNAAGLEVKKVTALDRLDTPLGKRLSWEPAVQQAGAVATAARVAKLLRPLRFFGVNAADSFQYYDPGTLSGGGTWTSPPRWKNQPLSFSFAAGATSYPLDTIYEDLKAGTQLLVDTATATAPDPLRLVAITEVKQAKAALHANHPQQNTVTQLGLTRVIRDAPTVLSRTSSQLDIFARSGTDSALYLGWTGSALQGWEPLGGILTGAPSAATMDASRLYLFACGPGDALLTIGWNGSEWSDWKTIANDIVGKPAAASCGASRLDVITRNKSRTLTHLFWNGTSWSSPAILDHEVTSDPIAVAVSWGTNRIDLFARGLDGALHHSCWNGGTWGTWESLGGAIDEGIAIIARTTNRLDVFARGLDGALLTIGWNGGEWGAWTELAADVVGTPAVSSRGASRLDVFARNTRGTLTHLSWNGTAWSQPAVLAGQVTSDPAAVSWDMNRIDLFVRGLDGGLKHSWWDGTQWQGWEGLGGGLGSVQDRRQARIYQIDPQEIRFREFDYAAQISGSRITVTLGKLDDVEKKRTLLLQAPGLAPHVAKVTGTARIAAVPGTAPDHLAIDFAPELPAPFPTGTTQVLGNVVRATHGQSIAPEEILGDGNASAAFQSFSLRQAPLTYLSSSKQIQGESTLSILVNGEKWTEVDSLYGQAPSARVYVLRQDDEGRTGVQFGDGLTGSRLPSGRGNIKAQYRYGLGLQGRVKMGQLSIPLTKPVGIKEVTNPAAAEGGADAEPRDAARRVAPSTVRTFGRAVSLADFETLTTASGEVAKASATWVWQSLQKAVHLTVAAQGGATLSGEALGRLHARLDQARDPNHALLLGNYCQVPVTLSAKLFIADAYVREEVLVAAKQALVAFFAFDNLALARSLHRSDIYAVLQAVPGVTALDLDLFHFKGYGNWGAQELGVRGASAAPLQPHLRIFGARPATTTTLSLDPVVASCLAGAAAPAVLPAEQGWLADADADLELTGIGGIG